MKDDTTKKNLTETTLKRSKRSMLLTLGFMSLNVVLVVVLAFWDYGEDKGFSFDLLKAALSGGNGNYLLAAGGLIIAAILIDTLKYTLGVYAATRRFRPGVGYKCGALGHYYDNITPMAIGGQPFQVHYLAQKKVPAHKATSIIVITFLASQITLMLLSPIFLVRAMSTDVSPAIKVCAWIGYAVMSAIPLLLIILSIKPSIAGGIVKGVLFLLKKLHILKNTEKWQGKVDASLAQYKSAMADFTRNKIAVALIFLLSVAQFFIVYMIPYFICRALGVPSGDLTMLFSRVILMHIAISFMPTPGGSVAAELSFMAIFTSVIGIEGLALWGMLFWRFAVFYVYLIQGIAIIIIRSISNTVKLRRAYNAAASRPPVSPPHSEQNAEEGRLGAGVDNSAAGQSEAVCQKPEFVETTEKKPKVTKPRIRDLSFSVKLRKPAGKPAVAKKPVADKDRP